MPFPLCREAESRDELFVSTRWTMVLKAGDSAATSAQALSALSELCQIYWRPLYVFLRKKGYGREDAQDLTQGFFAHLIATRGYAHADRDRGRFRAFLLAALKHFIADARDRQHALKRGGGMILEKLDDKTEAQIARAAKWQADEVYDREWAASLVRQAAASSRERVRAGRQRRTFWLLGAVSWSAGRIGNSIRRDGAALTSSCHYFAPRATPIARAVSGNSASRSPRHGPRSRGSR